MLKIAEAKPNSDVCSQPVVFAKLACRSGTAILL